MSKAYVVTAIGMLVDRGLLSIQEYMTEILARHCPKAYPQIWDGITVEMLLLHRVPLLKNCLDIDACDANGFGEDYLVYILNASLPGKPPNRSRGIRTPRIICCHELWRNGPAWGRMISCGSTCFIPPDAGRRHGAIVPRGTLWAPQACISGRRTW